MKPDALAPVVHFRRSVFGLANQRFALGRSIASLTRLELQPAILVADHPVIADRPLGFQAEDLAQFSRTRFAPVIILGPCRRLRKTAIVFRQICLLQILVRGLVTADYQNYLEEKWIKGLNDKYKVEINEAVLKTVKQ